MTEWRRSHRKDGGLIAGTQARIERAMNVAIGREADGLTKGLSFLATVGSIAPFVGLFGTVWGIKHAFEEIAMQQSTNLAVVAPGIAEALLATGLGLLAAIPAVIFYNKLNQDSETVIGGYEGFADEFAMILSRQLDAERWPEMVRERAGGRGAARRRRRGQPADGRDQRHADGRRDAGAADHLHGRGAAADRRRADRAAEDRGRRRCPRSRRSR